MAQYIPKAALVAEIEKLELCTMDEHMKFYSEAAEGEYNALCNIEHFLDTIEVKEVDLEKEINAYIDNEIKFLSDEVGYDTFSTIAKHFFELGIKVKDK